MTLMGSELDEGWVAQFLVMGFLSSGLVIHVFQSREGCFEQVESSGSRHGFLLYWGLDVAGRLQHE
jgi:hypothetical protein